MSSPKSLSSRRRFLANSGFVAATAAVFPPTQWVAGAELSADGSGSKSSVETGALRLQPDLPQHFFDDSQIAYQRKLVRRWLPAVINPKPVLVSDRPWEGSRIQMHGSILPGPDGGYRMYYSGGGNRMYGVGGNKVMIAVSDDGLIWRKPELNICPFEGKPSNILLEGVTEKKPWGVASISVIHDAQDQKFPYKLTSFQMPDKSKPGAFYVYRSSDGLQFEPISGKRFDMGDRNTAMGSRINGKFIAYVRAVDMIETLGRRAVFQTESENFLDWTERQLVLSADLQDEPDVEFYGMGVFRRHNWFIGLLEYWRADADVLNVQLAFSRDGKKWQRPQPRTSFIAPTYAWNRAWSNCASNGPIFLNEQMAFYFGGSSVGHHFTTTGRDGVIGLASLEVDRFCALEGTTEYGWVDTMPLIWPGGSLVVNADTRESFTSHPTKANGELFVEVLDEAGKQLPEWCVKKRAIFQGNTHCREKISDGTVKWPGGRNLDEFTGRALRLRFGMKHARLFTFEARKPA